MLVVEKKQRVLHLKVNIPPVNVLDTAGCRELAETLNEAVKDNTLAAVLLSGEGKCFSAGASVEEHKKEHADHMIGAFVEVCEILNEMPCPTAALVHGFCFGGAMELAMYCDFIVADPSAKFAVPEISLAFFPPFACSALHGIVGRQNAAHLIFTGETIDAERAFNIGLVQKIVEQSAWDELVQKFNNLSAPVLRLAKKSFRQGLKTPLEKVHGPIINEFFLDQLYEIEDVAEGIKSFGEKRKPEWEHK